MAVRVLDFAEPFFSVKYVVDQEDYRVEKKSIILNLSPKEMRINNLPLGYFRSTIVMNVTVKDVSRCLVVEDYEKNAGRQSLFEEIKKKWVLMYDATGLDRHKGVALWRSPKVKLGDTEINMCFAGSVPLNVGLHRTHWGEQPFKEVHTQILGIGKMQQCFAQDIDTLYREEIMAPGCTHAPMYDENCIYPWHQYETVTPGIFMAVEMRFAGKFETEG